MRNSKRIKLINDNIYNHIEYNSFENLFLQTKIVNRLLFVTQNALAYFSLPSINTKRYIHSIGTMHMVSYLYQYSVSNSSGEIKEGLLSEMGEEIDRVIRENNLDIDLEKYKADDIILHSFSTPLKTKKSFNVYMIILQSLRLTGLLHDLGHLPFSHQSEYALEEVHFQLKTRKEKLNENENKFMENYNRLTDNGQKPLHEKIGEELLEKLFLDEVMEINREEPSVQEDYIRLVYLLVKNIYAEKNEGFNYKLLHKYVSGTIDADRLDYINRDSLASGFLKGPQDTIKLAKAAIVVKREGEYYLSFLNTALTDIENVLVNRFNLYKKVIYSSDIVKYDSLLEEVIVYVIKSNLEKNYKTETIYKSISMMWTFLDNDKKIIENISQLDENWLITILKKEYFKLVHKGQKTKEERKLEKSFEVILFGRDYYTGLWDNLNEFFEYLGWMDAEREGFYKKVSEMPPNQKHILMHRVENFILEVERDFKEISMIYSLVDFSVGVNDSFMMTNGTELIKLDKVSTVKSRLLTSKINTVPFFLYIVKNEDFEEDEFRKRLDYFIREVFLR